MDHFRRSSLNFFTASGLDRAAPRRPDSDWVTTRLRRPESRVVPIWRQRSFLASPDSDEPVLISPTVFAGIVQEQAIFLGEMDGVAHFAIELDAERESFEEWLPCGAAPFDLRDVGSRLGNAHGALLAYARALVYWHRRHRHCGDCGSPTRSDHGGHLRVCTAPTCGQRQFPRTDPAVIVCVESPPGRGDSRCLLGRQPSWAPGMFSTVAGFVEPGESVEDAVVREVYEETGVGIGEVHYQSSQPWPFPSSLMLGFRALATDEAIERHDDELQDARWFTRDDIAGGLASGDLRMPRRVSIAFRLIESWFNEGDAGVLAEHVEPG